ncbi:cell filamentation protein Fic [Gulosibacter macacae]|uniref:Cell filamentation protein Fic n=1 Tax=Gulosibacter macacae TaxID=2488791 RepID=A0A3P3VS58_9MICO|nr:virulence RhuM family protein [Gulosibacter macacae]RRJ85622.1 cell filamentation protein Fic [Gulosibacter macacae]
MSDEPGGEIIVYQRDDGEPALEVRVEDETVWLSQQQIAQLFDTTRENITMHLRNVYSEGELDASATSKDFLLVRLEGQRQVRRSVAHYNLDAIISVGYRVTSKTATRFRIWATARLREYLIKGFTMDDAKLKNLGGGTYWRELLDRIRDIRSSEKVLYRQVLELYTTSIDYDVDAAETNKFFAIVQNKLHFAAHGHTAAEVVYARADGDLPAMGLTSFAGERPTKAEVTVAKNYLTEPEMQRLNRLVSAYFDAAEFRAMNHEPTRMRDWLNHLDRMFTAMDAPVLDNAGTVSRAEMKDKAEAEYEKYKQRLDDEVSEVEAAYLAHVKQTQRNIEGTNK